MNTLCTKGGIELTEKQTKCVKALEKVLKTWDRNLQINAVAGTLYVFLAGNTEQNSVSELSDTGGFNPENIIEGFNSYNILCDGGDW